MGVGSVASSGALCVLGLFTVRHICDRPAHALALVAKGVTTLEQLRREPGLTHQQQLGLKYYDDLLLRIPRSEMDQLKVSCSVRAVCYPLTQL